MRHSCTNHHCVPQACTTQIYTDLIAQDGVQLTATCCCQRVALKANIRNSHSDQVAYKSAKAMLAIWGNAPNWSKTHSKVEIRQSMPCGEIQIMLRELWQQRRRLCAKIWVGKRSIPQSTHALQADRTKATEAKNGRRIE